MENKTKTKLAEVALANGDKVYIDGETAVDSYVYCNTPSYQLIDGKKAEIKYPVWGDVLELADGNVLILADSKIVEITKKEAQAPAEAPTDVVETGKVDKVDEPKPETETKMETKDTKLADGEVPAETPAASDAPAETPADEAKTDDAAIMAIVKPMFDEVYKKLAELQTMIETSGSTIKDEELKLDTKMSSVSALAEFFKSVKN